MFETLRIRELLLVWALKNSGHFAGILRFSHIKVASRSRAVDVSGNTSTWFESPLRLSVGTTPKVWSGWSWVRIKFRTDLIHLVIDSAQAWYLIGTLKKPGATITKLLYSFVWLCVYIIPKHQETLCLNDFFFFFSIWNCNATPDGCCGVPGVTLAHVSLVVLFGILFICLCLSLLWKCTLARYSTVYFPLA